MLAFHICKESLVRESTCQSESSWKRGLWLPSSDKVVLHLLQHHRHGLLVAEWLYLWRKRTNRYPILGRERRKGRRQLALWRRRWWRLLRSSSDRSCRCTALRLQTSFIGWLSQPVFALYLFCCLVALFALVSSFLLQWLRGDAFSLQFSDDYYVIVPAFDSDQLCCYQKPFHCYLEVQGHQLVLLGGSLSAVESRIETDHLHAPCSLTHASQSSTCSPPHTCHSSTPHCPSICCLHGHFAR